MTPQGARPRPIEPIFHFVWYGRQLPDFACFAMASALRKNRGARVLLWHESHLLTSPIITRLGELGLETKVIDFAELSDEAARLVPGFDPALLRQVYDELSAPAARSNLVRLLVLYLFGGIYLDTDTLTLRSLEDLRSGGAFCGLEHVLWPAGRSKIHPGALLLDALRWIYGALPGGTRVHQWFVPSYAQAANNAVLGFCKGHVFCAQLLAAATKIPKSDWLVRYRFGTHLLQRGLGQQADSSSPDHVRCLPPEFFYPLGPVISQQYFRTTRDPRRRSAELLSPETHVVHWYASVAELKERGAQHVSAARDREVFSYLCAEYLDLFTP